MNQISIIFSVAAALLATFLPQNSNVSLAYQVEVKPKKRSKSHKENEVSRLVKPVVEPLLPSIASFKSSRRLLGTGLVISEDGKILTKHSNLRTAMTVEVNGIVYKTFKVIGILKEADLAVLEIDATGLQAAKIDNTIPSKGDLLISLSRPSRSFPPDAFSVGVMSESIHEQQPHKGFLGIRMLDGKSKDGSPAVLVTEIIAGSTAAKNRFRVKDLIKAVGGKPVASRDELVLEFSKLSAGDSTSITLERNGLDVLKHVILGKNPEAQNRNRFAMAFGHDTKLDRDKHCGGPIVDLQGRIVGINVSPMQRGSLQTDGDIPGNQFSTQSVARRLTSNLSKAIPGKYINAHLKELTNGKLAPLTVNRNLLERNAALIKLGEEELAPLIAKNEQFEVDRLKEEFQQLSEQKRAELTKQHKAERAKVNELKKILVKLNWKRERLKQGFRL